MALNVVNTVTVTPQRSTTDLLGNTSWANITPISGVFFLNPPLPDVAVRGEQYMQTGEFYAPRGSDLHDGDRVPYQGKNFDVVGEPQFDQNHPLTGYDFGWVAYDLRLG